MRYLLGLALAVSGLVAQDAATDIPALLQAANAAYMRGDYEAARQSLVNAWTAAQQTAPSDPVRYDILKRLTSARAAAGEFADADQYLQQAITWRENTLGHNDPKIADDLLISVGLCRGLKDFDRARTILFRVMGLHRIAYGPDHATIADDYSRMAQLFMDEKNLQSAVGSLKTALEMRTKSAGPLDPSLVPDLDRIAGAWIALREYEKAEEAYRHALVIRETLYGKNNADLISTVDGLAYACFGQKKYDEAEPIYQRLIALWVQSVGEDHPMVSMALDKVATFYSDQKKFDQAKEAYDRANAIRAHFLAVGLSVQATEFLGEEKKEPAISLYRRALVVLDPPSPVNQELKEQIEGIVKAMEAPPPKTPPRKAPPRKK
jgi:tetratricopeptide (TPR) repeat protein